MPAEPEPDMVAEPEAETAEPEAEPEMVEPEPEAEMVAEPETEPEPEAEMAAEPEDEPEPDVAVEAGPETADADADQAADAAQPEPASAWARLRRMLG
jgi:hypothetical protein